MRRRVGTMMRIQGSLPLLPVQNRLPEARKTLIRAGMVAATMSSLLSLGAGAARADETSTDSCTAFCAPIATSRLAGQRAQGTDVHVSVILWDELHRQAAPPPPPSLSGGMESTSIVRGPVVAAPVLVSNSIAR
jgi:hypothetical protein